MAFLFFLVAAISSRAGAATLSQQIDPPEVSVGDEVTVTITVQDGSAEGVHLPTVEGLQLMGSQIRNSFQSINGSISSSQSEGFLLTPLRPGDFTIPAFDINLRDGGMLHVQPMKLHVLGNAATVPGPTSPAPAASPSSAATGPLPSFNPNGPVVMPPNAPPAAPATPANASGTNTPPPTDSDGRPLKVFIILTPQTLDAYVGQSIPMRIDFFIRLDVDAQQDSLPTIKGSDFLMNSIAVRPQESVVVIGDEEYHRETWGTAISAPKGGDFPLQMERDTYWSKNSGGNFDPFSNFFNGHPNLAHELIASNQLTVHVHALPDEGRPANFSGAIGQFTIGGAAEPLSVAVGEPVNLRFTVSGAGNFDYVKCPSVDDDPSWKRYTASSKTEYDDVTHTEGTKTFQQSVVPRKNGTLPLPPASFSYFDPATKKYTVVPIPLPAVTVTGSVPVAATPATASTDSVSEPAPMTPGFLPNRIALGSMQGSLLPVYHRAWFWAVQGGLAIALAAVGLLVFLRSGATPDMDRTARALRESSLHREEDAMHDAVQRGDAPGFFLAARHAVQLRLGTQWSVQPEALTLVEIRRHDPDMANSLEPLFTQADEIIYSGRASGELDLARWERHVNELLQPQPA